MSYKPSKKILENYAKVIVDFALGGGKGIKRGDTVLIRAYEPAKPLYAAVAKRITQKGGNIIHDYRVDDPMFPMEADFIDNASAAQLSFCPKDYYDGLIKQVDHSLYIVSPSDMKALSKVDPNKLMLNNSSIKYWRDVRTKKELDGKFSWTICNYGTQAMADEAELSLRQYWNQIIKACFLDTADPVAEWKKVFETNQILTKKLNSMSISQLHMQGPDVDLIVSLSPMAKWVAGSGENIPSFEVFTSPDWRGTEGWIRFNQPLYRYSNKIEGIYLEFKKGKVTKATATKNSKLLKEMIAVKDADKLGEFSLTDSRTSRITKVMADTLFDENIGGPQGNTHIALGMSFRDCYKGDPRTVTEAQWKQLGYNNSAVHTDLISTTQRTVTALLGNGKKEVIYQDGKFLV